jgi:hypothetical protein
MLTRSLPFHWAAKTVERRLGVSWGSAQKMVDDAIKSNAIKTEWRSEEDEDILVLDHGDFDAWLASKDKKKSRSSPQVALAQEAITAVCPDGKYPPTPQLEKLVGDWLKSEGRPAVKRDAILRAIGRRK